MKNKALSALLSFFIAFGLWLYVITVVSPGSTQTYYNVPVVTVGETVLEENGLIVTAVSAKSVDIKLSGNRTDLINVNSSNITLKMDLSKIYDPGVHKIDYTTTFPGNVASNAFTVENKSPESITVTVEKLERKQVPVNVIYEGSVPNGYITDKDNVVLDSDTVMVQGPRSVVDRITQAMIRVTLTEQRESISRDYRYTLCDKNGAPVDAQLITTNMEEVHVDLLIHQIKDVNLVVKIVDGGGASSETIEYTIDPESIKVSGSKAALESLGDEIVLGTINLRDCPEDFERTFEIPEYDGINNESGITEVTVKLKFLELETKEFILGDIQAVNVPEGLNAELITEKLTVVVRGLPEDIEKLKWSDVTLSVDFSNASAGTSTYRVTVNFAEGTGSVGALGSYSVSATLTEKGR